MKNDYKNQVTMEVDFRTVYVNNKYPLNVYWVKKIKRVLLYKLGNEIYKTYKTRKIKVLEIKTEDDIQRYLDWRGKKGLIRFMITIVFDCGIEGHYTPDIEEDIYISFKVNNKIFFIDEYAM